MDWLDLLAVQGTLKSLSNITVIQINAPTTNAEEAERFYDDL